jgi:hypothetical protein
MLHRRIPPAVLLGAALMLAAAQAVAQGTPSAALKACPAMRDEVADLHKLADALGKSDAVGWVEKLRLKSSIDELIGRMRDFHRGARRYTLAQLQEQYDLLMMRIAGLLQDNDKALHGRLCNAWHSIWATLQDRQRFEAMSS